MIIEWDGNLFRCKWGDHLTVAVDKSYINPVL